MFSSIVAVEFTIINLMQITVVFILVISFVISLAF